MLSKKLMTTFPIIVVTLFLLISVPMTSATPPVLTLIPDMQQYNVGQHQTVRINGNLTYGGAPVSNATVAMEVDNPKGNLFLIRTMNTGSVDPSKWPLAILALTPCDSLGNPRYSFNRGDSAFFRINVTNRASNTYYGVLIYLTIVYSNKAPFWSSLAYNGSYIDPGQTIKITTSAIIIPSNAVTGNTTVYANVYNKLPKKGGYAYCPEKSAYFSIGTGGPLPPPPPTSSQFTLEIALDKILVMLGNYTVYGTVLYSYYFTSTTTWFKVILLGDITSLTYLVPDGKVNMLDIGLVATRFGKTRTSPGWVPQADLYPDGKINMIDVGIVAGAFGITAVLDP